MHFEVGVWCDPELDREISANNRLLNFPTAGWVAWVAIGNQRGSGHREVAAGWVTWVAICNQHGSGHRAAAGPVFWVTVDRANSGQRQAKQGSNAGFQCDSDHDLLLQTVCFGDIELELT